MRTLIALVLLPSAANLYFNGPFCALDLRFLNSCERSVPLSATFYPLICHYCCTPSGNWSFIVFLVWYFIAICTYHKHTNIHTDAQALTRKRGPSQTQTLTYSLFLSFILISSSPPSSLDVSLWMLTWSCWQGVGCRLCIFMPLERTPLEYHQTVCMDIFCFEDG